MPERRKMKSPSPSMTSTPKMKRKDWDKEVPRNDINSRLGLTDNLTAKKEFPHGGVEFTEYNDGTTRPIFKKRLKNVCAKTGEMVQLECIVSGSPLPKILWLKNNRPLKASDVCQVMVNAGTNTLVFPSARDEDVGTYTARAMNINGSVTCSAEFTLIEGRGLPCPPVTEGSVDMDFTTPAYFFQMSSCDIAEGRLARFDCRVVAYPKPEIVWMRDGKVIEVGNRFKLLNLNNEIYSLLIQDVQLQDTGRYTCWARNKFGEAMTEAYLNVIALKEQKEEGDIAPKFLTKFYDLQTTAGTDADFKCLIEGRPEPTVSWLLNDIEIKDGPGIRIRNKEGVVSFEVKSPRVDQSGLYTCLLNNSVGEAACSAHLTVVEDKLHGKMLPKFLKKFDHVNAKEGEDVKFSCLIVGEPKPNVTWLFDHKPISDVSRRFQMKVEGDAYTLIIKNVRFDDTGKITCQAVNVEGEVYCSANLNVHESKFQRESPETAGYKAADEIDSKFGYVPTFTRRLQDMQVKEGSRVVFEGKVMGIPEPEISWMKDGRVILTGGRYRMTNVAGTCQLVIDNVSQSDTGVYTCIVSNTQGKSSSTAELKLEDKTKKERYTPDVFDEKTFKKEPYTPDKYILEDSTYLDTSSLEDESTKDNMELLEMRAPPRLPTKRPIVTDFGHETLQLAWRPAETYQAKRLSPVTYSLETKELPGKDWMPLTTRLRDTTHYLSELQRDRDYMIRVRAENDFGVSEPTEPLWIPRARAFPGVPVTRPLILEVEDSSAKLSWTRVDIPSFAPDDTPLLYMLEVEEPNKDWRTVARDLDDTEYIVDGLRPGRDYRFRVRAKTPTGIVSEPSPSASLYTALARSRVPIDKLEVLEYEPDTSSVHLSWQPVYIPPYNLDDEPLLYMIEYQEPPLPDWKTLISGVPTTRYRVSNLDPLRDYNFRVRAVTSFGVSPPSAILPVTFTQSPVGYPLPETVTISDILPDSLRLSWRRPTYDLAEPVSYQIEMLESPLTDWRPIATEVTDTTYRVTGLKPTKDYQFRVIPQADTRWLQPTLSASLTNLPVRPRLPLTEPKLQVLSPESVNLSWHSAELPAYQRTQTPIYYSIEMAELPSSNWVPVVRRVPETTYTVTGLRPDSDYKFRVLAETDSGVSEPSMPVSFHRRPIPRFMSKEPTVRDLPQNGIQLSWQPAEITEGFSDVTYMVEIQTPPGIGSWNSLYTNLIIPSVHLADLRPDLDYLVRVRAQSGTYLSEPTLPVYIPRRAVPPRLSIEEPYAVDITGDSVALQWRSADLPARIMDYSPVSYILEVQEQPNGNWVTVTRGIPHTDFKVTGLNPDRDYAFRIRAENEYGVSDPTRPMTLKCRSVAPIMPQDEPLLYDVGAGSARLSWRPASLPSYAQSASPITYTIYIQELPYQTWRPLVKRIPHTFYYISGLPSDKDFLLRVQAENSSGSSKPTNSVRLPRLSDYMSPISMPEVSDFDEDLMSVKLQWKPKRAGSPFDKLDGKYTIETWEPIQRSWKPIASGIPDTSYHVRGLPKLPDHLFRVQLESDQAALREPSIPVSVSKYYSMPYPRIDRPQLYELDNDTVRLSWQPVQVASGISGRSIRYTLEQREMPETSWLPVASNLMDSNYKVRGLSPKSNYEFRVKAVIDGTTLEPSYPVSLFRQSVLPKVQFNRPEIYDIDDASLSLRWNTVDVPAFSSDEEPLLFIIERQTLPDYEWLPVATDITDRQYTVRDLKPYQDYNFRVRGLSSSGYTDPSPYVPVYRRPIRYSVPVAHPEVWEEEPQSARLKWQRAYIPRYYSTLPLRYRVEMQEAGTMEAEWKAVAYDVTTPEVTVSDISPHKDYNFRIRAQLENGDLSEPTPPIQYHRSKMLMTKGTYPLEDLKPVKYEVISINRPYWDVLAVYVPPRMPIDKPDMVVVTPEHVELSWKPAHIPDTIRNTCNLSYTIEVRCPPSFEWRELVSGLKICSHTISKLHPRIDYIFRVRAWNEYGCSEPSLPVSLYRPASSGDYDDDEEFEREWQLRYGQEDGEKSIEQVPPKLPIDTPKVVTQTSDSIWFTWIPARIPAYATQTKINYVIEIKEPPCTQWKRDVTGLLDCQYIREGLNPNQEYHIRVRAETEFGASEPTLPIILRGKGSRSGSRRSSVERDEKGMEVKLDLSYLENLTSGVPPRMASTRPTCSKVGPDHLTLSWTACRVPSYVKASSITYIIEKRELPGHIWATLVKDIKTTKHEITGLNPDQDYMFRVRAKNEFGAGEPTLPLTLYRDRDDYVPPISRSRSASRDSIQMLVSRVGRRSSSIDYGTIKSQVDTERSAENRSPLQPEYITTTYDKQYGVAGRTGKICLQVRAYPIPVVHWYFGDEKLELGSRYSALVSPSAGIYNVILEIKSVGPESIGQYKCYAENEHGTAIKMITFELADPPTILEPIKDQVILEHETGFLTCRVDGFPSPNVKWMKDWRPFSNSSSRIKMVNIGQDTYSLEISDAVEADDGLYACIVENIAGKVTVTGRLIVEMDRVPGFEEVTIRSTPLEDRYYVMEEIHRGKFGVVRRVIEISTGRSFAGNFVSMRNKAQKDFFLSEFEVLCSVVQTDGVLHLYDAFETERSLILITEIVSGPELLDKLLAQDSLTECKVAAIIKKLLVILKELDTLNVVHLDIKPANIRMCGPSLDDIKLIGFEFSRVLHPDEDITCNYGSVGYASPEQVANDVITKTTDIWVVGVLTYVLLFGSSPFQGNTDVEIANQMMDGKWSFDGKGVEQFSQEARDFISKLLVRDSSTRLTVDECLNHPWLATNSTASVNIDLLRNYYSTEKMKREREKMYTTAQVLSFAKLLHGAKTLYQPAIDKDTGEIIFPDDDAYGDYLDEDSWYEWQLQYLDDLDTQDYPLLYKDYSVRENQHVGAPKRQTSIKLESEENLDVGESVIFRDKIQNTTFTVGEEVTFACTVIFDSVTPVITWYRDEQLLSDDYRAESSFNVENGLAKLKIVNTKDYDAAVYKCVARDKDSRVSCQARLMIGDCPGKPGRPIVTDLSGTEAFLTWTSSISDGNSYILGYRVDYRKQGEKQWTKGLYVIGEYALISGLEPNSSYTFRVSCHNKYGTSPFSLASLEATTRDKDAPNVTFASMLQPLMEFHSFHKLVLPAESRRQSLTVADVTALHEANPADDYDITESLAKGAYGEYKICSNKTTNRQCVAKIVAYSKDIHSDVTREFEILRVLRQGNIIIVVDTYIYSEQLYMIYEQLSGLNVIQYLCVHKFYKEETIAMITRQILDALQYLQHYGIVHLNLQPSSVVMATRRRPHVKLQDFTSARKLKDENFGMMLRDVYPDFVAPEVIKGEAIQFSTDAWMLGVLTFTMLSGSLPFAGKGLEETLSHILFNRFSTRDMYDNVSPESVQFVTRLLRRLPRNRASIVKCLNSPWLQLSDSMMTSRSSRIFKTEKLLEFSEIYLANSVKKEYKLACVNIDSLTKPDEEHIAKLVSKQSI